MDFKQGKSMGHTARREEKHAALLEEAKTLPLQLVDADNQVNSILDLERFIQGFPYRESAAGLRRGELLGLKWEDTDLERGAPSLPADRPDQGGGGKALLKTKRACRILSMTSDGLRPSPL